MWGKIVKHRDIMMMEVGYFVKWMFFCLTLTFYLCYDLFLGHYFVEVTGSFACTGSRWLGGIYEWWGTVCKLVLRHVIMLTIIQTQGHIWLTRFVIYLFIYLPWCNAIFTFISQLLLSLYFKYTVSRYVLLRKYCTVVQIFKVLITNCLSTKH